MTLAVQLRKEKTVGIRPSLQGLASRSVRQQPMQVRPPLLVTAAVVCMAPNAAVHFNNSLEDP